MDVHHHAHTERKKFTHYLWEFLMLFLAVFCGFLAENLREHQVEHSRERKYIQSLIADLKTDTAEIQRVISYNFRKLNGIDSLANLINKQGLTEADENQLYILRSRYLSNIYTMIFNDRTIRQLLSSGNLRLIKEQAVSDSIMNYYGQGKDDITGQELVYGDMSKRMIDIGEEIFDNNTVRYRITADTDLVRERTSVPLLLMTHDKTLLKRYGQMALTAKGFLFVYLDMLLEMNRRSKRLLSFLQSKYGME